MRSLLARRIPQLALFAFLLAAGPAAAAARDSTAIGDGSATVDSTTTTIVLVRHAEKSTTMIGDVPLSAVGFLRAKELAHVLGDTPLDAIYVTPYLRNRETAEPLAKKHGDSLHVVDAIDETVRRLRTRYPGKTVCVVGHSNTLPQIIELLTGRKVEPFLEGEYDRLYVVTLAPGRPATLLRLNYGAARATTP